ncbi:MAG: hypothetical protein Q8887_02745, partial [Candidatus Phytoplasma australasiaticum]|nr:hypothetical protein [Candidatus Phytoplasma australasiaticum]
LFEGILLGSAFVVMDVNNFILLPVFMFALICVCFIFVLNNASTFGTSPFLRLPLPFSIFPL